MFKATVAGTLARDPRIVNTSNGQMAFITVASDRGRDQTDFIELAATGNAVQFIQTNFRKGTVAAFDCSGTVSRDERFSDQNGYHPEVTRLWINRTYPLREFGRSRQQAQAPQESVHAQPAPSQGGRAQAQNETSGNDGWMIDDTDMQF